MHFVRFEQEILGAGGPPLGAVPANPVVTAAAPALVIGANTFASVQEQLASLRAQVFGGGGAARPAAPAVVSAAATISAGMNVEYWCLYS